MEATWGNLLLYMCIFTPSCLPSKESGKQGRTPPHMLCSHSLLSPGRTKTLSHWPPQPPPAKGFSQVSQKSGFSMDLEELEFLSASQRPPWENNNNSTGSDSWEGSPIPSSSQLPHHPGLLPSAHNIRPTAASLWAEEWLFTTEAALFLSWAYLGLILLLLSGPHPTAPPL